MHGNNDSDQVADHLPVPLESSSSSDDPATGHSNALKEWSSKHSEEKRKSTQARKKARKNMGHA